MTALEGRLRTLITLFSSSENTLQWGGWENRFYSSLWAIEPTHLLVVTLQRFQGSRYRKYCDKTQPYAGPLMDWDLTQTFDPNKHLHAYRLIVLDPANRFDSRRVCDVVVNLQDGSLFELVANLFAQASAVARYPTKTEKDPLAALIKILE